MLNNISPGFRDALLRRNLAFAETIEKNGLDVKAIGIGKPINFNNPENVVIPSVDFNNTNKEKRDLNVTKNNYQNPIKDENVDVSGGDNINPEIYGEYYNEKNIASNNPNSVFHISNQNSFTSNTELNRYALADDMVSTTINTNRVRYNGSQKPYLTANGELNFGDVGKIKDINLIGGILSGNGVGINGSEILPNFDVRSTLSGRVLSAMGEIDDTPLGMIANARLLEVFKNRVLANTQRETIGRVNLNPIDLLKGGDLIDKNYEITVRKGVLGKVTDLIENYSGFTIPFSKMSKDASIFYSESLNSPEERALAQLKNTGKGQVHRLFEQLKQNTFIPKYQDNRIDKGNVIGDGDYSDIRKKFKDLSADKELSSYNNLTELHQASLLGKTQNLFKNGTIKSLVSEKGRQVRDSSEIRTDVTVGSVRLQSKGSGVKSAAAIKGVVDPDRVFGRVFTKEKGYSTVGDLQRKSGLLNDNYSSKSVLDDNGFVKIGPTDNEGQVRNCMFSIENLAFQTSDTIDLPENEKGPRGGRIMWFPPYDLRFTDTSTANWDTTTFIGRGEPVYTYNNTERSGSLDFSVIIDYPSYLDDAGTVSNDILNSLAAGAIDINEIKTFSVGVKDELTSMVNRQRDEMVDVPEVEPNSFSVFYDNDITTYDSDYEKEGLNSGVISSFDKGLLNKLKIECPSCEVIIVGYRNDGEAEEVGNDRANGFSEHLKGLGVENKVIVRKDDTNISGCLGSEFPAKSNCKKKGRKVDITFKYNPSSSEKNRANEKVYQKKNNFEGVNFSSKIAKKFYNENFYFNKLQESSPLHYAELKDKIKFFHPAFHSITPEGFNSRLNFLHQCTRQGPTLSNTEENANNLAFGRPPICVLRIGDFYHTKIVVESVGMVFEPLKWDLNPEGVGVQPMICKVSLSFKFIGGSSLSGPIDKLQNAVSFNYFGNTEIYDKRSEKTFSLVPTVNAINNTDTELAKPDVDEMVRAETENSGSTTEPTEENNIQNMEINTIEVVDNQVNFFIDKKDPTIGLYNEMEMEIVLEVGVQNDSINKQVPNIIVDDSSFGFKEYTRTLTANQRQMINEGGEVTIFLKHNNLQVVGIHTIS